MSTGTNGPRLVVVPSEPIDAYEKAGYAGWLERYYNPTGLFREVFAVSPLESGERQAYGMTILGVSRRHFRRVLERLQPDVVRAYGGYWPSDLVNANRIPGVPIIVSLHDAPPVWPHWSVQFADLVVCVSGAVAQGAEARGTDPRRIRRLPNRVDTQVFRRVTEDALLAPIASRFPAGRHVLFVGRRTYQKNVDTMIRALARLPADYSCVFIGRGENARYLALAEAEGVAARCFWVESVPSEELARWYSWCDCMCTPSRYEGFGIVFIEAAACGAAIVTSDVAPMNEYLEHGKTAHLVRDCEDPDALAAAVRRVCEDEAYRRRLGQAAAESAKVFDRGAVDEREAELYREALSLAPRTLTGAEAMRLAAYDWLGAVRRGIQRQFWSAAHGVRRLVFSTQRT